MPVTINNFSINFGPYHFPEKLIPLAITNLIEGKQVVARLRPEKRTYTASRQSMTEAAIDPGLTRDLYVAMGEPLEGGAWAIRVYYKPFVRWIWLGGLFMAIGGVLAATDRRYRVAVKQQQAVATEAVKA